MLGLVKNATQPTDVSLIGARLPLVAAAAGNQQCENLPARLAFHVCHARA
jgi:hypothetical protein